MAEPTVGKTRKKKGAEETPALDHARLRILAAIEKHTNQELAKAVPTGNLAAAESKFHALVGELGKRRDYHTYHDQAAAALIAAGNSIKRAKDAQAKAPTRLDKLHQLVGRGTASDRHLMSAGDLLHAAHAFTVLGDKTMHERYGQALTDFAKQPIPERKGFHAATFMTAYRGDLAPKRGLAKHLVRAIQQFNTQDQTGGIERLRLKAVRPPSDAPKGLDAVDPVIARRVDADSPKTMMPGPKKTDAPKRLT